MKPLRTLLTAVSAAALIAAPAFAQTPEPSASAGPAAGGPPSAEDMQKMMELSKLNENHKLLGELAGTWSYTVKMWMDPSAPPQESKGTAVRKEMMGGRFYVGDFSGKMEMPGPDGKKKQMTFTGKSIEGYDNVKQKFVSTWVDNMGTGIMMTEGTYDPATKTFNYNSEIEMMPGMKTKVREKIQIVDKDHHILEWYEDRGGNEVKTMEISYTRSKK
jgi:hypothetical protein